MAINPPSDLVMDVARAADPQAYRMAAERLRAPSVSGTMVASAAGGLTRDNFASFSDSLAAGISVRPDAQNAANPAYRKFEAFMLQSFVQSMFTSDTTATFGKGIAGEYWKSMMAEAMANKMADGGGVGIAKLLEEQAARNGRADAPTTLALGDVIDNLGDHVSENAVSKDIVHGFERKLIQKQLDNNSDTDSARG
ncbi:flagellar biosynthesis protein FlgJ [Ochrobactrum pecoris]|uniref:Flagellar biosynthesis protein FlgJ n=1 Tax=Brucella pecoris TaxID=867683 RepID=A0A5C5CH72_9HYPH|nr:rod-binding protein [Brucella pecoris]MBB4095085.1 Rod binding domain-containing protein [Brucella pecoris]NKW81751.1 flagellar biosynthesis protein FlgJ [Brucella pecoris]TNV10683.1 flagellar biosynthesis protein FlgJ [Brucella pecoris]